jgi:hypothetical protein
MTTATGFTSAFNDDGRCCAPIWAVSYALAAVADRPDWFEREVVIAHLRRRSGPASKNVTRDVPEGLKPSRIS